MTALCILAGIGALLLLGLMAYSRIDDPREDLVWYEARISLQAWYVRFRWNRRVRRMEREGRAFLVPGHRKGTVTWDDAETWTRLVKGMAIRQHLLKIEHNDPIHDMDNDAIVLEFATSEELDIFRTKIPPQGPQRFDFMGEMMGFRPGTAC